MADVWGIVEAIGTAAAAGFAATEIYRSRRDANRRATLEHLRNLDERVQAAWQARTAEVQQEIIRYYESEGANDLSDAAVRYMALLNSLDLLAFAMEKKMVDSVVASEHVKTLLRTDVVSQTFLRRLQTCCGDAAIYEHLYRLISHV